MGIPRRVHEWAAGRFSFVQYPPLRRRAAAGRVDKVLRWGAAGWLLWAIWAPVLACVAVGLILLFS